jgi:hypothetical protein
MPVERERFILGEEIYPPNPGVQTVAQGEVNDAVNPPEGNGRFGPVLGQRIKPLSLSPGEDHGYDSLRQK